MTKKLLLALAFASLTLTASAEKVSLSQAKSIAQQLLGGSMRSASSSASSTSDDDEQAPLYILSRGEGAGFVIVSGDDRMPEVIGYTDQGDWDEASMPPALLEMITYYTAVYDSIQTGSTVTSMRSATRATTYSSVDQLLSTHWHQSWPYNMCCPYLTGTTNQALTGCVATAASQIIYYWHKDLGDRTKYTTPTYGYGDAPVTESEQIASGTPLKWDLMQTSYSSSDPSEMTTAVGTLVACVGMSGWLTYGSSTSGQISDQVNVFASQFGLNGGSTVWRSSYSQSAWEKMIISDLTLGRPILYSGVHTTSGGHAIVLDGYNASTGLFHFNFGWGASGDGWYTVDDSGVNGFSESQGMVYNVYPKTPNLTGVLVFSAGEFTSRVANTFTAKITNNGTLAQSGFYVYCLTGTNTPSSASSASDSDASTVVEPGETKELTFEFTPSSTSTYTIYLCDANKNILDKITDVSSVASVADLTLNSLSVDHGGTSTDDVWDVYNTKKANVTASFTNGSGGTLCQPSVKGILYVKSDGEWVQSATKTKKNVTYGVGETADMVFDLTGLTDGAVYKFALEGTASTNKSFDIANADQEVCFTLVGSNLTMTDGAVTGNWNETVFASLAKDTTQSVYDMAGVTGVSTVPSAGNLNALFYFDANQGVSGRNVIVDGVCAELDLTPGYNFEPKEDFVAMAATYHATQAVGLYGTAVLPFDAETPTGLMARKVNAVKTSYLTDVDSCNLSMAGGTPYIILSGEPIDITAKQVTVSTQTASLGTDTLRGTWVNMVATDSQWVLDDADTQYFNSYTGEVIPALTGYLEYTRKVRVTSQEFTTKDKKARLLAEQIESALATYETYLSVTTSASQATFLEVIDAAREVLRTQPITSEQTSAISALSSAAEVYIASASATADNGLVDKSAYVSNPSFELGSTKGWTASGCSVKSTSTLANYMSGTDGTYYIQVPAGKQAEQTLSDIENGTYQLVVSVAADYGDSIVVYAGTQSTTVEATEFGPMYFADATLDDIVVSDGTLTIGVASCEGWAKADNFRLYQVDGPSVGIAAPTAQATATVEGIYDLAGRRLSSAPAKGIYIINGKKVIK